MLASATLRSLRSGNVPRLARMLSTPSGAVEDFDIVVVGGGIAGSAFAAAIQCAATPPSCSLASAAACDASQANLIIGHLTLGAANPPSKAPPAPSAVQRASRILAQHPRPRVGPNPCVSRPETVAFLPDVARSDAHPLTQVRPSHCRPPLRHHRPGPAPRARVPRLPAGSARRAGAL